MSMSSLEQGPPGDRLALEPGAFLYSRGETREGVYFIRTGAVAIYQPALGAIASTLHFSGKGDYVGVGFLSRYAENAKVLVKTTVDRLTSNEFDQLAKASPELRALRYDATEKEFEALKQSLAPSHITPVQAVSRFLIAVSSLNAREGRNPHVVCDDLSSQIVADLLQLDISDLQAVLVELQSYSLVEQTATSGLRLNDLALLARFAEDG